MSYIELKVDGLELKVDGPQLQLTRKQTVDLIHILMSITGTGKIIEESPDSEKSPEEAGVKDQGCARVNASHGWEAC